MNLIYVWANVLLESYSNLIKFADAVDSEVKRVTLLGSSDRFNTMELSNYVIDLIEKKIALCNTKVLIEEIIRKMDKETQKFIILKYIDRFSMDIIAKKQGLTLRTAYRRLNIIKEKFAKCLLDMGYTDEKLRKIYKNQLWIYNSFVNEIKEFKTKEVASKVSKVTLEETLLEVV